MAKLNLDFDDEIEETFVLLAIHCSEEEYKVAYLLNLHLETRFARRTVDLDFTQGEWLSTYPIYDYEDEKKYDSFHLVANKCRSVEIISKSSEDLFGSAEYEKSKTHYLFPEFKTVDYFLKIYSDFEGISIKELISKICQIKEVISAYAVDLNDIKNQKNLIFD